MACEQLAVQEYQDLIRQNPDAKGFDSEQDCLCCDIDCPGRFPGAYQDETYKPEPAGPGESSPNESVTGRTSGPGALPPGRVRWADGYPAALGSCAYSIWTDYRVSSYVNNNGDTDKAIQVSESRIRALAVDGGRCEVVDVSDDALVELVDGGRTNYECRYSATFSTLCDENAPPAPPMPEWLPDPIIVGPDSDCSGLPESFGKWYWFDGRWNLNANQGCQAYGCSVGPQPSEPGSSDFEYVDVGCV